LLHYKPDSPTTPNFVLIGSPGLHEDFTRTMDINLLPFNAFALESFGTPATPGAAQTLTLQLELGPVHPFREPMAGTASTAAANDVSLLRAAVVPACATPLTITF
jgi:hypothetical protein